MCTSDFKDAYDFVEDEIIKPPIDLFQSYYDYAEDLVTGKSTQNPIQELYEPLEDLYKGNFAPPNPFGMGSDNRRTRQMTRDLEGYVKDAFRPDMSIPQQPAPSSPVQPTASTQASADRGTQPSARTYGTGSLRIGSRNYGGV